MTADKMTADKITSLSVVLMGLWKYRDVSLFWRFVVFGYIGDVVLRRLRECLYVPHCKDIIAEPFRGRPAKIFQVPDPTASPWVPRRLGIIERILLTMLIAWNVNGAAAFIGTWIVIKTAGMAWQTFSQHSEEARQDFGASLMLSGVSAFFGILGGLLFSYMCSNSKG